MTDPLKTSHGNDSDTWPFVLTPSQQVEQLRRHPPHTPEGGTAEQVRIAATDSLLNGSNAYTQIKPAMDQLTHIPFWGDAIAHFFTHQKGSVSRDAGGAMEAMSQLYTEPDALFKAGSEGIKGGVNHGLLTHNQSDYDPKNPQDIRSVNRITSANLLAQFPAAQPSDWPQLILTANHAQTRGTNDLADIMQGIGIMAADCMEEDPAQSRGNHDYSVASHPSATEFNCRNKNLTVMACAAERDAYTNGMGLIYRYNHLLEHPRLADRVADTNRYDGLHDAPSPAAARLGKLMLKLMVENPDAVDLDDPHPLMVIAKEKGEAFQPPVLRADAAQIAKHITLIGYSKGANTVSDAARVLMGELALTSNGKSLAEQGHNNRTFVKKRSADGDKISLKRDDVAEILRSIGNLGLGGGEVPITEEEHALGFRRVRVNNVNDLISQAFIEGSGRSADDQGEVNGSEHHMGHAPDDALGTAQTLGYIAADPVQANKIACIVSGKFGKASLVALGMGKTGEPTDAISFRFGPSTTPELQQKAEAMLEKAFKKAEIGGEFVHEKGDFTFKMDENITPEQLKSIENALHTLGDGNQNLVVSLGIYEHIHAKATGQAYTGEDRFLPAASHGHSR